VLSSFQSFLAVITSGWSYMMSPEPFIQKCKSLAAAKNTYLDVVDGRVRLAWMNDGVIDFMERADAIGLGVSYDTLLDALSEAGGAIDSEGRYPINDVIRRRLMRVLNTKCA
jgi:hypothetical protein